MLNSKNIVFVPIKCIDKNFYPQPAINNIPEWYKKTNSYLDEDGPVVMDGKVKSTIKKCLPFFDAMTAGYILFTHIDIYIRFDQNGSHYSCPGNSNANGVIEFHSNEQAENHPNSNIMPYPKFINPWSIQTPKGYSSLFMPPMHNPNGIFNIFSGIVDTDSYHNPVNLPFVLNSPTFEGIIPAGTPICQVIPFKRDNFKMIVKEDDESIKSIYKFSERYSIKFFNNYKTRFWQRKSYK